jgi:hypothetical protein
MGVSERSSDSLGTFAGHAEHVFSVADGAAPLPAVEAVSSSWQRSATKYGVDPVDNKAPRILTSGELKDFRAPLDELVFSAQEDMLGSAGCGPRRWRARTASARASSKSDLSPSIGVSILGHGT